MMKSPYLLLFCFSLLLSIAVDTQAQVSEKDTLYVWANSGLNMRKEASTKGEKLIKIPFGTALKVESSVGDPFVVEDSYGLVMGVWALVEYEAYKGYVFSGYLHEMPPPREEETDLTYFMRVFGPVQATHETIHNEGQKTVRKLLQNGVYIHSEEEKGESMGSSIIFLPELEHSMVHLLVKQLYAVPKNFKKEGFIHKFDEKAKLITVEEKDGDVGCYYRIQLLFGATGGEEGAAITQYCGC